jgi:hypothetical protein
MERLKLDNTTTIAITPVGEAAPKTVLLTKVLNAIESSDNKFIRIDGKVYTHTEINAGITDGSSFGCQKFSGGTLIPVSYLEVVKAIKTFGLQHILKIHYEVTPGVFADDYFKATTLDLI